MGALSSVLVKFSADISDVQIKMKEALDQVSKSTKQAEKETVSFGGSFNKLRSIAVPAIAGLSSALGGLSVWKGVKFDADLEQAQMSFETLLKSADGAKAMISDLQKLGAETPFEFPDLQNSAKLLLAMGMDAKQIMPSLTNVGDAVAAIGGNGDTMEGVSRALGQMLTKGKVSAEEMQQMAEKGLPVWDILAQKLGKSTAEVMSMSSQGKLLAKDVVPLLVEGFGDRFGGAMQKQSRTFTGLMSTLTDSVNMLLGKAVTPLFDKLKQYLPSIIDAVGRISDGLANGGLKGALEAAFPPAVATTIIGISKAIQGLFGFLSANWGIIQPILLGLGSSILFLASAIKAVAVWKQATATYTALRGVLMTLSPTVLIVAASVGVLVAAGWLLYKNWDKITAFLVNTWETLRTAWSNGLAAITNFAVSACGSIEGLFAGSFDAIWSEMVSWWGGISQTWTSGWNGLIYWLSQLPRRAGSIMALLGGVVLDAILYLPNQVYDIGQRIVEGLFDGINSLRGWLYDRISGFLGGAVDWAKGVLGIHSPSRVFAEIGKYTVLGFSAGVDKYAGRAADSAGLMAQSAVSAASSFRPSIRGDLATQAYSAQTERYAAITALRNGSGSGQPTQIEVPVILDGREIARASAQHMDTELNRLRKGANRAKGVFA